MPTSIQLALLFLINTLFGFYFYIVLLRLALQYSHVSYYNALSQLCVQLTEKPVRLFYSLKRLHPQFDFATLAFFLTLECVYVLILFALGQKPFSIDTYLFAVMKDSLYHFLELYFYATLLLTIASWLPQQNPDILDALLKITHPILRIIRRWIPLISGFDFSPLILMVGIKMLEIILFAAW